MAGDTIPSGQRERAGLAMQLAGGGEELLCPAMFDMMGEVPDAHALREEQRRKEEEEKEAMKKKLVLQIQSTNGVQQLELERSDALSFGLLRASISASI